MGEGVGKVLEHPGTERSHTQLTWLHFVTLALGEAPEAPLNACCPAEALRPTSMKLAMKDLGMKRAFQVNSSDALKALRPGVFVGGLVPEMEALKLKPVGGRQQRVQIHG